MNGNPLDPLKATDCKGTQFFEKKQVSQGDELAGLDALSAAYEDEQRKPSTRPRNEAAETKCRQLLETLLEDVKPVNFDEKIPHAAEKTPSYAEKYVCIIDELIRLAEAKNWGICRNGAFVYLFNGAYWQPIDREELKHFLSRAAYLMGLPEYHARQSDVADKLLKQFDFTGFKPQPESDRVLINLQNGTLEISGSGYDIREFDSADFLKYQLSFDYDENATAPRFQEYLNEVLPDKSAQNVLAEYCGYIFVKDLKLEKALILYGSGANGKSVFFDVITALFGSENVSNYDVGSLCDESGYNRAMIQNTLINYGSEIGTSRQFKCDTFKRLVSGEPIQARLPYGRPFEIRNYARFIFNANTLPKNVEQTNAYFRRFLIIPFDVTIPQEKQDKDLAKRIIDKELAGVLNWVLDGLKRIMENRSFSQCEAADKALEAYRIESDNVLSFVTDYGYIPDVEHYELLNELYGTYKDYCIGSGLVPSSSKSLSKRLKDVGFVVKPLRSARNANVVYCRRQNCIDENLIY